ncbi:MAG: hypothetical protein ABL921_02205 [Pirellula sp.]
MTQGLDLGLLPSLLELMGLVLVLLVLGSLWMYGMTSSVLSAANAESGSPAQSGTIRVSNSVWSFANNGHDLVTSMRLNLNE